MKKNRRSAGLSRIVRRTISYLIMINTNAGLATNKPFRRAILDTEAGVRLIYQ